MLIRRMLTTAQRSFSASSKVVSPLPKCPFVAVRPSIAKARVQPKAYRGLFAGAALGGSAAMIAGYMVDKETEEQQLIREAKRLDKTDPFPPLRDQFTFPKDENGKTLVYLNGNSLGLPPVSAIEAVLEEMKAWGEKGVRAHFDKKNPWVSFGDIVRGSLARLINAKESEVVAMGGLSGNIHVALISFYRPTKERYKIIRLGDAFGSDRYAIDSEIHQRITTIKEFAPKLPLFDAKDAVIEIKPKEDTKIITTQEVIDVINQHGDKTSVVFIEGVNYLSGQNFDLKAISAAAHAKGCYFGVDLAHSLGNTFPNLHDDQVDFAFGCTYKYLNSGPGGIAVLFIHENHHNNPNMPRLSGWWGQNEKIRFDMTSTFSPIKSAAAWQQSNPPIWQLASLRASLDVFDKVDLKELRAKSQRLTAYAEQLLTQKLPEDVEIITPKNPEERGSQLSLKVKAGSKVAVEDWLYKHGVVCDARGEIIRMAPAALYNNHEDVARFVIQLRKLCLEHKKECEADTAPKLR